MSNERLTPTCNGPVCNHVEDSTELAGLTESACSHAVKGVEETAETVKEGACHGVALHVVESQGGEDDATITDEVGDEEEDVLGVGLVGGQVESDVWVDDVDGVATSTSARGGKGEGSGFESFCGRLG